MTIALKTTTNLRPRKMTENIIRKVKTILDSKFYVTNDTWLKDCLEYYLKTNSDHTDNAILQFVTTQWQLCDLREINVGNGCLPKNLSQEKFTTLRGHFILQMDKIYDISESKYKQLEKIRNVSNVNIQVTEAEETPGWEPKKKRMLQLFLTDGAQDVIAIEYKPIRHLSDSILPGYKLMIKGPVACRRGVILLEESNVAEIGGEVETFLVPNAVENVLARALGLEENPDPYNDKIQPIAAEDVMFDDDFDIDLDDVAHIEKVTQENTTAPGVGPRTTEAQSMAVDDEAFDFDNDNVSEIRKVTAKRPTANVPVVAPPRVTPVSDSFQFDDDDFDIDLDRVAAEESGNVKKKANIVTPQRIENSEPIVISDDDFDVDFDEIAVVEENSAKRVDPMIIDDDDLGANLDDLSSPNKCHEWLNRSRNERYNAAPGSSTNGKVNKSAPRNETKFNHFNTTESDNLFDMIDENEFLNAAENVPIRSNRSTNERSNAASSSSANSEVKKSALRNETSFNPFNKTESHNLFDMIDENEYASAAGNPPIRSNLSTNGRYNAASGSFANSKVNKGASCNEASLNPFNRTESDKLFDMIDESKFESAAENPSIPQRRSGANFKTSTSVNRRYLDFEDDEFDESKTVQNTNTKTKPELSPRLSFDNKSTCATKVTPASLFQQKRNVVPNVRTQTGNKRAATVLSSPMLHQRAEKVRCTQETPKTVRTNRKITDFLKKDHPSESPSVSAPSTPKICDYISDVLAVRLNDNALYKTVRGKVTDFDKLSKNGQCWELNAKITDGTASMDVTFSSEILEKMLGFSVSEFSQKKRLKKTNPEIENQLRQVFRTAERDLNQLDALLKVELARDKKAKVVCVTKMTDEQKKIFDTGLKLRVT